MTKNQTIASTSTVIPTRLRHALRLIHFLQKERGASSSFYAAHASSTNATFPYHHQNIDSSNSSSYQSKRPSGIGLSLASETTDYSSSSLLVDDFLESIMINAREGTDAAFILFLSSLSNTTNGTGNSSTAVAANNNNISNNNVARSASMSSSATSNGYNWENSLKRVRACVDSITISQSKEGGGVISSQPGADSGGGGPQENTNFNPTISRHIVGSHRIVVMFNLLIGNIIDEAVVRLVQKEQNILKKGDDKNISNDNFHNHNINVGLNNDQLLRSPSTMQRNQQQMPNLLTRKINKSSSLVMFGFDGSIDETQSIHYHTPPTYLTSQEDNANSLSILSRSLPNHYRDVSLPTAGQTIAAYVDDSNTVMIREKNSNSTKRTSATSQLTLRSSSSNSPDCDYHEYKIPITGAGEKLSSSLIINGEGDKQKNKLNYLMSLLLSFVRLKESIGLERAILSNLMASHDVTYPNNNNGSGSCNNPTSTTSSISKLLTGLVVEDANQRKIIRELQSQSKKLSEKRYGHKISNNMSSLLSLMEDMVRPSKDIDQLQEMIRTNFNLEELRKAMPYKKFWDVLSMYMDKLHSIELLLVEELQSMWVLLTLSKSMSLDEKKRSLSQSSFTSLLTSLNQEVDPEKKFIYNIFVQREDKDLQYDLTDKEAITQISQMPSEQVKRLLMSHLKDDNSSPTSVEPTTFVAEETLPKPNLPKLNIPAEWDIDLYEVEFRKRIGRGVGGTTYLAEWSGQNVAVKVAAITDLGLEGWQSEINSLQRLHHPNVIRLLGSIYNPSPQTYGLVLEYCESGDLSSALNNPTPSNFFWRVAEDVAKGMNYLHRKNILHRDIKPANVLLSGNVPGGSFTAKLSDFGVAIMHYGAVGEEHTAETGTYRWMPPEIIRHEVYSYAADVYSYALVVWQLVTHELPFKNYSQIEAAGKVAVERARPPFPHGTPELIIALIETCWRENPDERLSFAQILIELKEIFKVLSEREKLWLSVQHGHPVYDITQPKNENMMTRRLSSLSATSCDNLHDGDDWDNNSKRSSRRNRRDTERSKSPHRSIKGGGLFSIFHPNRYR
jgi:serine/threonine protein kinase